MPANAQDYLVSNYVSFFISQIEDEDLASQVAADFTVLVANLKSVCAWSTDELVRAHNGALARNRVERQAITQHNEQVKKECAELLKAFEPLQDKTLESFLAYLRGRTANQEANNLKTLPAAVPDDPEQWRASLLADMAKRLPIYEQRFKIAPALRQRREAREAAYDRVLEKLKCQQ